MYKQYIFSFWFLQLFGFWTSYKLTLRDQGSITRRTRRRFWTRISVDKIAKRSVSTWLGSRWRGQMLPRDVCSLSALCLDNVINKFHLLVAFLLCVMRGLFFPLWWQVSAKEVVTFSRIVSALDKHRQKLNPVVEEEVEPSSEADKLLTAAAYIEATQYIVCI